MNAEQVQQELKRIERMALTGRHGWAHYFEDAMHAQVLETIALGEAKEPNALAAMALQSLTIKFVRASVS